MNTFTIEIITRTPQKEDGLLSHWGRITIGNYSEMFIAPISSWHLTTYKKQWHDAFERLKVEDTSLFVTAAENIGTKYPLLEVWPAYKTKDRIIFHNMILINENTQKKFLRPLQDFCVANYSDFIWPRNIATEESVDGSDRESSPLEWSLPLSDFLSQTNVLKESEPEFEYSPYEHTQEETQEEKSDSRGSLKFHKDGKYITPDKSGNGGSYWKKFDSKYKRIGSLDKDGNRIQR